VFYGKPIAEIRYHKSGIFIVGIPLSLLVLCLRGSVSVVGLAVSLDNG
jgi:hypothetical protein